MEEDSTRFKNFGDFTAKPIGDGQWQWHYQNRPVFIIVNSYGWPMLEKLSNHQMQLIKSQEK
jgi:hypothetical protein